MATVARHRDRYRQSYLDLLATPKLVASRSCGSTPSRRSRFYDSRGFVEVETPTLHPIYGGGTARPSSRTTTRSIRRWSFASHPALPQAIDRRRGREVYELARVVPQRGNELQALAEATMLESYEAYWTTST